MFIEHFNPLDSCGTVRDIDDLQELPRDEEQDTSTHRFVVQLPKKSPKEVAVRITADDEAGKVRCPLLFSRLYQSLWRCLTERHSQIVLTPADPNVGSPFWIGFHLEPCEHRVP